MSCSNCTDYQSRAMEIRYVWDHSPYVRAVIHCIIDLTAYPTHTPSLAYTLSVHTHTQHTTYDTP
ncbi:hypothetical protein EON63_07765 [archaeon]|nr:MAG: hypothetical protein EON63_07765 [archaeon]